MNSLVSAGVRGPTPSVTSSSLNAVPDASPANGPALLNDFLLGSNDDISTNGEFQEVPEPSPQCLAPVTLAAQLAQGGATATQGFESGYQQALLGYTERSGLPANVASQQFLQGFESAMQQHYAGDATLCLQAQQLAQGLQGAALPIVSQFLSQLAPYLQENGMVVPSDAASVRALFAATLQGFVTQNPSFNATSGSLMLRTWINEALKAAPTAARQLWGSVVAGSLCTTVLGGAANPADVAGQNQGDTYQPAPEGLWGPGETGPSPQDITGGGIGDCYVGAAMAAVANSNPQRIQDNIKYMGKDPNGTDVYMVRMYTQQPPKSGQFTPEDMLVTATFPTNANGALAQNGAPLWAQLYEKAFAQLNDEHHLVGNAGDAGYDAIGEGGWQPMLEAMTGVGASPLVGSQQGNAAATAAFDQIAEDSQPGANMTILTMAGSSDLQALSQQYNLPYNAETNSLTLPSGAIATAATQGEDGATPSDIQITPATGGTPFVVITNHMYSVLAGNPAYPGDIIVRNPWGGTGPGDASIGLTVADLNVLHGAGYSAMLPP